MLLTEEALAPAAFGRLRGVLDRQPPWSDLPLVLMTRDGTNSAVTRQALERLGNVVLLERPVRTATLISAVQVALRGRSRQYEIRAHLAERERLLAETEQARRAAEAAVGLRDQFLAIATHELRTPLTALVGYAALLQRRSRAGGLDDADGSRMADIVLRQAQRLTRLVEQLFDVSRIERGYLDLEREVLDLGIVVEQVTEEFRLSLADDAARRRIEVTGAPEGLLIDGDAARLEQVVRNLLSNAVKYSPGGGVVRISVARQGTEAAVTVTDGGIGIPAAAQGQLFDSFYRASNVGPISGFGVGLHVVRAIVERHGGRIAVASVEGAGSTFTVSLPLVNAPG